MITNGIATQFIAEIYFTITWAQELYYKYAAGQ